jgi:hypothetical protein
LISDSAHREILRQSADRIRQVARRIDSSGLAAEFTATLIETAASAISESRKRLLLSPMPAVIEEPAVEIYIALPARDPGPG